MAQVLVRGLDDGVVGRLRMLAELKGRSLEAHLRIVLTEAARLDRASFIALADRIAAESRPGGPDSVELIREARAGREERWG